MTAVEWLESELNLIEENKYTPYIDLKIKQAKEMEIKQIKYYSELAVECYKRKREISEYYKNK